MEKFLKVKDVSTFFLIFFNLLFKIYVAIQIAQSNHFQILED